VARIVAVVNQKGGVGKTTTTVNLAACLGELGQRVLVVDSDPQSNATTGLGIDKRTLGATLYEVLLDQAAASETRLATASTGVDILPATVELTGADLELVDAPRREYRLRDALRTVRDEYDLVLIDCPPSLGLLTLNALVAADGVLIPIQCEFYALEGYSQLLKTVLRVRASFNRNLAIDGVLLTMYDGRTANSAQVASEVRRYFAHLVFDTVIARNVRLAEAPSHGQAISTYDSNSKGAVNYRQLAEEVVRRAGQERVG